MSGPSPEEIFRQEAQELLEQLENALLDLEGEPGRSDLVDSAFRALHTIKGSGAMFGFEAVAAFTHHVETAFDRVRQGKVRATRPLIKLALSARDHIRGLIEDPQGVDPSVAEPILAGLRELVEGPGAGEAPREAARPAAGPAAGAAERTIWRVRMRLPRDCIAMGTNPLLLLDDLRALGDATVTAEADEVPALEELVATECHLAWTIILTTSQPRTAIEDVFLFVIDEMELQIERVEVDEEAPKLGEILIARGDVDPRAVAEAIAAQRPVVPTLGEMLVRSGSAKPGAVAAALAEQQHVRAETRPAKTADSVRVPAERLDDLMDRVGELVIVQSRLSQVAFASSDPQVKAIAEDIERLALELRDSTMGVRTVPIGSLFGRFRRLIHDVSSELGKHIDLVTVGEETELDKTVIEKLNDPLIHLLRNSMDHGLEPPDGRLAAGKPATGRITLTARHAGAEVLISIVDDGRGLDRERIRARAEENGILQPGAVVSDSELFAVIFEPGFSTARQVTSLSGRGVGMDVVKRAIEALRGKIEIASKAGKGTEITLRLPLTLAIIDGLLVRVGQGRYVLPLSAVEECVELSAEQDARSRGRNFLNIRGDLVPFLRLRELFAARVPADPYQKVVVVSAGKSRVGLVVDQVIGNHQTVIKSLSRLQSHVEMFSGATILGDGAVALILDVAHLVDFGQAEDDRLRATG